MDTWDFTFYWRRVAVRDQHGWWWFSPAIQITYRKYDENMEYLTFYADTAQDEYGYEQCVIVEAPSRDDFLTGLPDASYYPESVAYNREYTG